MWQQPMYTPSMGAQKQKWQSPMYSPPAQAPRGSQSQPQQRGSNAGLILSILGGAAGAGATPVANAATTGPLTDMAASGAIDGISHADFRGPDVGGGPPPNQIAPQDIGGGLLGRMALGQNPGYGLLGEGISSGVDSFMQGYQGGGVGGGFGQIGSDLVDQGQQYINQIGGYFK